MRRQDELPALGKCPEHANGEHFIQERSTLIYRQPSDGKLFRIVECRRCHCQRKGRGVATVDTLTEFPPP